MQEQVPEKEAKQGRSGKQVLIVMIVSMALLIAAYVIYNIVTTTPVDRQAISWLLPVMLWRPRGRQD